MNINRLACGMAALVLSFASAAQDKPKLPPDIVNIHRAAAQNPHDAAAFDRYLARLPTHDMPNGVRLYVVEGDLLLTRDEVRTHLVRRKELGTETTRAKGELVINIVGGKPDFWPKDKRRLDYSVARGTFGSDKEYQIVVDNMKAAARAWEHACPGCGIAFRQVDEKAKSTFTIQKTYSGNEFIAAAFFPSTESYRRVLLVDASYFTATEDKVGILRHEIGHILGYRHEHVHDVTGCDRTGEDGQWRALTDYDPGSVMHYFCGGGGTLAMALTGLDIEGHRKLYLGQQQADARDKLVVRIEGGEAARDLATVVLALHEQGMLQAAPYELGPGDTICSVFTARLDFPARLRCPLPQFQSLLASLNPGSAPKNLKRLRVGQSIMVPEKLALRPYSYSKVYYGWEERTRPALAGAVKMWNVLSVRTPSKTDKTVVTMEGYELLKDIDDPAAYEALAQKLASRNLYIHVIPATAPDPVYYAGASPDERASQCDSQAPTPVEGNYLTMIRNASAGPIELPACAMRCKDGHCAQIHFVDTPVFPNPDIRPALANYPNDAAGAGGTPAPDTRLCTRTPFRVNVHHSTHLSGIMVSQPNGFGFIGLSPAAQLFTYERAGMSDPGLADLIQDVMSPIDYPRRKIFLFATRIWDYPPALLDAGSAQLKDPQFRFRSLAATRLSDIKPIGIIAAGQPDESSAVQIALELRTFTPLTPMNLGDLHNIIVVTSCEDCSDASAKLAPDANYSGADRLVHVAAPGRELVGLATTTEVAQPKKGGTSQAAAFVAGLAASMINCHGDYYPDATTLRQRLMLTSRSVFDESEFRKLRAGIIDAEAALLDPSKHWLKRHGDTDYREIKPKHWCTPQVALTDPASGQLLDEPTIDLKQVRGVARYARDPENADRRWIFLRQPSVHDTRRSLPGAWQPAAKLLQLDQGTVQLQEIEHLLLARQIGKGECT